MIELKPCPFCGEKDDLHVEVAKPYFMLKRFKGRYVFAGCNKCGAITVLIYANNKTRSPLLNKANTKAAFIKAAEAWNRRADNG